MKLFTLTTFFMLLTVVSISQNLSIGNRVWWDINDNGIRETFEPNVAWVAVTLYADNDDDGIADAGFTPLATYTDGAGLYSFSGLAAGKYFVKVAAGYSHFLSTRYGGDPDNDINNDNNGYRQDLSTFEIFSQTITLAPGTEPNGSGVDLNNVNNTLDIGTWKVNGLGDHVWLDNNANGLQDTGEPGIANVTVRLKDQNGNLLETTTTDASGNYYFYDPLGYYGTSEYQIEFLPPTGYKSTHSNAGGNDDKDNDAVNGVIANVSVPFGKWDHSFDAGFVPSGILLPVDIIDFTVLLNNGNAELKWVTENQSKLSHFIVERSIDGSSFKNVGVVFAINSSDGKGRYNFKEEVSQFKETVIYYRLRSVDIDAYSQLSATKLLRISKSNDSQVSIAAYPNPATSSLRVSIPISWQNKRVSYKLVNMSGQTLQQMNKANASQTEAIDISSLQPGIYLLVATYNEQSATQKISKQ